MLAQATSTVAVVVTFHPDAERLLEGLHAILPQVDAVVVVDNGSSAPILDAISELGRVTVLKLEANHGIGFAQNRGIDWARSRQADFVLLLDQDSVAADDMVARLRRAHDELAAGGVRIGPVGPAQVDGFNASLARFTCFRRARYSQVTVPPEKASMACDVLIASGSLIPITVLDAVGAMNEDLFIDKVDTEWCLRVGRAGYEIHGVPAARLYHRLGESALTVSWWRGKRLPVHKPFRYYYMVRNSILLQRMPRMRWGWRTADLSQMVQIILFHGLLAPASRQNRPMILRGLRDGISAVSGPISKA
ncbi:glycosyltransferase family 2 protein [Rivibacter subsaxonicus]|uniref:glycosyltransferase family 2 protein n=1 Tax=Rivibacter subsaxonicus TaxID=457575 RepID=UPI0013EE4849|nr:glycosyltransferase family 2 protein [Rivibacter subsaxonicus]